MASPTLLTEAGLGKMLGLIDATVTTSAIRLPVSVTKAAQSAGGDATRPPGWLGVATHNDGEALLAAGGWTLPASNGPVIHGAGRDFAATPIVRGFRTDENGLLLPAGYGHAVGGFQLVDATAGGTVITNTTAETALSVVSASKFGYLAMIHGVCSVVGTNAGIATWTLKDGATGTTLWTFDVAINSPVGSTLGSMGAAPNGLPIVFPVPLKTNAINKAFTLTASVNTLGTWRFHVNGFLSTN